MLKQISTHKMRSDRITSVDAIVDAMIKANGGWIEAELGDKVSRSNILSKTYSAYARRYIEITVRERTVYGRIKENVDE